MDNKFERVLAALRTVVDAGKRATERPWHITDGFGGIWVADNKTRGNVDGLSAAIHPNCNMPGIVLGNTDEEDAVYITAAANFGDKACEGLILALEELKSIAGESGEYNSSEDEPCSASTSYRAIVSILNLFLDDISLK